MGYGEIYKTSWWGTPEQYGWGAIYYDFTANGSQIETLLAALQTRAANYENVTGTTEILTELENCT
jgi:hypothetical protein